MVPRDARRLGFWPWRIAPVPTYDQLVARAKKIGIGVGAVILIVLGYALDFGGKAQAVWRWLHSPTIEATSMSGDEASGFLAGQPIRFSLKRTSPDTAFWIFEEKEVQLGGFQNDHTFPFDPKSDLGIESHRRVDVFFKEGANYHVASTLVTVRNVQIASAKIEGSTISLSVSPPPSSDWTLRNVSLGKFEDGVYKAPSIVNFITPTVDKSDASKKLVILDQFWLEKLGVTFGRTFDPEAAKGVTAYFDFENSAGKKLQTVKNLTPQIKELQNTSKTKQ
jgi:hypothetical protein